MPMDFFALQDHARRQTTKLIVLFVIAVAIIIAAVYLIAVVALHGHAHGRGPVSYWDPALLLAVAAGTSLVIGLASAYKVAELAGGGEVVAQMVGGRLIDPQTRDPAERQLLNVVEEMSIASGVQVPPVYVLDGETSINAFAAGYQPSHAVLAVSRGCLEYLTRDELQGVLGHEFSHILNGDMRLNLRLIGIVYGILALSIIGYYPMRIAGSSGSSSRDRDDRRGDGASAIFFIGLAVYILGYLGVLLGNIIKAAISRQREFLADASSVQFTRNPAGLAGALKKIGGLDDGSRIRDAHAHEISHMFFGDAFAGSLFNLFATHPPLEARIRLLDPNFDGAYPPTEHVGEAEGGEQGAGSMKQAASLHTPRSVPLAPRSPLPAPGSVLPAVILDQVGTPQPEHLEHAERLVAALPPAVLQAAREPYSARAMIFALLLSREDKATRDRQWQLLRTSIEPPLVKVVEQLSACVDGLSPENRLPAVDMAIPALKRLSPAQYQAFRQIVEALTAADGRIDLFEYCLRVVLFGCLDVQFGLRPASALRYKSIAAVAQPAVVVLSALAYAGPSAPQAVERAFRAGGKPFPPPRSSSLRRDVRLTILTLRSGSSPRRFPQ